MSVDKMYEVESATFSFNKEYCVEALIQKVRFEEHDS